MYLERAFKKLANVFFYDFKATPLWTNFYDMLPFYLPKGRARTLRSALAEKGCPRVDLVIEVDGAGQHHLSGFRQVKVQKALWSLDTHLYTKRSFQSYFAKEFDHVYSCHKNFMHEIGPRCKWLPVACDPEIHRKHDMKKIYDIVFIGTMNPNNYTERISLIERMKKKFNIKIFSGVYGEDMAKIYSQAKIVFNKSLKGDLNMRVFEAISCGSMLLTDRLPQESGLEEILADKQHFALYNDGNQLEDLAEYYLAHDDERESIALEGMHEVQKNHTYLNRAQVMLKAAGLLS
jgi:hypothetical protein